MEIETGIYINQGTPNPIEEVRENDFRRKHGDILLKKTKGSKEAKTRRSANKAKVNI